MVCCCCSCRCLLLGLLLLCTGLPPLPLALALPLPLYSPLLPAAPTAAPAVLPAAAAALPAFMLPPSPLLAAQGECALPLLHPTTGAGWATLSTDCQSLTRK